MSLANQKIVDAYITAYEAANGFKPKVTRRGSWYWVGPSGAFRISDLVEMTKRLQERIERRTNNV
jgi:hypothetical protein